MGGESAVWEPGLLEIVGVLGANLGDVWLPDQDRAVRHPSATAPGKQAPDCLRWVLGLHKYAVGLASGAGHIILCKVDEHALYELTPKKEPAPDEQS